MKKLANVLASFDLPPHRKTKTTPQNLKWLLRNIRARNADNPKLEEAETLIKQMLKN